jgi:hypothetical protein
MTMLGIVLYSFSPASRSVIDAAHLLSAVSSKTALETRPSTRLRIALAETCDLEVKVGERSA